MLKTDYLKRKQSALTDIKEDTLQRVCFSWWMHHRIWIQWQVEVMETPYLEQRCRTGGMVATFEVYSSVVSCAAVHMSRRVGWVGGIKTAEAV